MDAYSKNLSLTEVSDLTPISSLTNLKALWLDGAKVSDLAVIEKLMPGLEIADLKATQIDPVDCKLLQEKWYQKEIQCP